MYNEKSGKRERSRKNDIFCLTKHYKRGKIEMAKRGNFFIRLCYGYVGRYKDTSKMTAKEVIEEFLKSKGVASPREFFEKRFIGLKVKEENADAPITPITEEAINRVRYIDIPGYTQERCQYIVEQHKELLRYATDNNDNKEVAFVFRKGFRDKEIVKGNEKNVNFTHRTMQKGYGMIIMHNHPSNSSFSLDDLQQMFGTLHIKTMTIVKNNGEVEALTKTDSINDKMAYCIYQRYKEEFKKGNISARKASINAIRKMEREGYVKWTKEYMV